ncbi:MAG: SIMPL domain-containing protein [Candidatus Cryptobacteroides sp.]
MEKTRLIGSCVIAAAIVVCGLCLPKAVREYRSYDRTVSVKGLCEREVMADKVIWPITFKNMADDLGSLTAQIEKDRNSILEFLRKEGLTDSEITVNAPFISDKFASTYGMDRKFRYISKSVITVCSHQVENVTAMSSKISELLKKGILIGGENEWDAANRLCYEFEGLNDIKPEMIQQATANARVAAEQFADDSGSRIGKIKTASQGTFSISDRDSNTPQIKKVRVVSSITYCLDN